MKIIGKEKDYYDYVVGEFGVDEKAIFKREPTIINNTLFALYGNTRPKPERGSIFSIAFCGQIITGAYYEGKFEFGDDIDEKKLSKEYRDSGRLSFYSNMGEVLKKIHGEETDLNDVLGSPIILLGNNRTYYGEKDTIMFKSKRYSYINLLPSHKNIILKDFGISKVISPQEAFVKINNFMLKLPEVKSIQSNEGKIEAHGFDLKKSFRHRKV